MSKITFAIDAVRKNKPFEASVASDLGVLILLHS